MPGLPAIDFIKGQNAFFTGDEAILKDEFILNFHLKPSRIYHRINHADYDISSQQTARFFEYGSRKIVMIQSSAKKIDTTIKVPEDQMIISCKSFFDVPVLLKAFNVKQVVMDGSVPAYSINRWKPFLDQHQIPYHAVAEKGAFVFDPN